jgi:hypothetical protein
LDFDYFNDVIFNFWCIDGKEAAQYLMKNPLEIFGPPPVVWYAVPPNAGTISSSNVAGIPYSHTSIAAGSGANSGSGPVSVNGSAAGSAARLPRSTESVPGAVVADVGAVVVTDVSGSGNVVVVGGDGPVEKVDTTV